MHKLTDDTGKLILRLTVGGLMLFHGISKIQHHETIGFIGSKLTEAGLPPVIAFGVYCGEVLAPLLLILGVLSRTSGLVIVINMLIAVWLAHTADIFALSSHGGWRLELQAFYLFGGLAIVFLGSGKYAARPG